MSVQSIPQPFTNLQLELLKLYAREVSEEDLLEIKELMANFFMDKATAKADQIWEAEGLKEDELLNRHLRTPYNEQDN